MFALTNELHIDAAMWSFLVSTVIPPIVGYLTKLSTTGTIKAALALVLNLVNVVIGTVVTVGSDAIISKQTVLAAVLTYMVSHRVYADFWKPKGITSSSVVVPDISNPGSVIYLPGKLAGVGAVDADMKQAA